MDRCRHQPRTTTQLCPGFEDRLKVTKTTGCHARYDCCGFSRDGMQLVSASYDETTRLWNLSTGQEMQKFAGVQSISSVNLISGNGIVLTNRGVIPISGGSGTSFILQSWTKQTSVIKDGWIQIDGRNHLWLPHEYRRGYSAFCDDTFVFGILFGAVRFKRA